VTRIWGWLIHATFVFAVEMPVYVCPDSSWLVVWRNLEVFSPLVGALGLEVLFV